MGSGGWSALQYPLGRGSSYSCLRINLKMRKIKSELCQFHNVKEFFSHLKTSVLKYWNINVMAFKKAWVFAYSMKVCGTPAVSFRLQFAIVKITAFIWCFFFFDLRKRSGWDSNTVVLKISLFLPLKVFLVTQQIHTQRICNQVKHQKWSSDLMLISAALLMVSN